MHVFFRETFDTRRFGIILDGTVQNTLLHRRGQSPGLYLFLANFSSLIFCNNLLADYLLAWTGRIPQLAFVFIAYRSLK